jgi:SET domain-containing protein
MHGHSKEKYIDNIKDTVVIESSIHNFGLWAIKKIEKGTLLCSLQGQVVRKDVFLGLFNEINKKDFFKEKIVKNMFVEKVSIDENNFMVLPFRTKYSYINHSDKKNHLETKIRKLEDNIYVVDIYAAIDIEENEEIVETYNLKKHINVLGGIF